MNIKKNETCPKERAGDKQACVWIMRSWEMISGLGWVNPDLAEVSCLRQAGCLSRELVNSSCLETDAPWGPHSAALPIDVTVTKKRLPTVEGYWDLACEKLRKYIRHCPALRIIPVYFNAILIHTFYRGFLYIGKLKWPWFLKAV